MRNPPHTIRRLLAWLPLLLWMAAIFYISHQPKSAIADFGAWDYVVKKGGHFGAYAILAVLARWALPHPLLAWLWAVLYAVLDEYHQTFIAGRFGSLSDVLIDSLGALAGLVLWAVFQRRRDKSGQKATPVGR